MGEPAWYRYGLRPGVYVTLSYDDQPSVEDLDFLIEYVRLHRRGLERHAPEARRAAQQEGEGVQ
jgi:hypothetical protein